MASTQFPNNTGQTGIYHTGSPNYVDVNSTYIVQDRFVSFAAKATDDSWADGDILGIRIEKDATAYKVWKVSWDATYASNGNEAALVLVTEEDSVGTITDGDSVLVTATVTNLIFDDVLFKPQFVEVSGVTHTALAVDSGKVHRCTNGSAVTVTLGATLPVGWHAVFVQEGAGLVSFARDSTDTINGSVSNIDMSGQYRSSYVYQHTEGVWIAVV